jgi:serine phosphatase RsbU (regulator of sigma subunit)/antitoxin component YwqK of YwqJK toxin-antitoxin module
MKMKQYLYFLLILIQSILSYSQNNKDGLVSTFHKNGKIATQVYYDHNEPNGVALIYDTLGYLKESGYWYKNRWVGNYNEYYRNGSPIRKYNFGLNGKRIGLSTSYHQNGLVESIVFVLDGKQEGLLLKFDSIGKQAGLEIYSEGNLKKSIEKDKIEPYTKILTDYVTSENLPILRLRELVSKEKEIASKEIEITNKESKLKQEKTTKNYILFGLSFISILLVVILVSLVKNKRANKIISAQKDLVERQKHLVDEKNQEITDSINYAQRIQRSLLASDDLLSNHLPEHFILFQPKDVVSGDFYWAIELSNSTFAFVTADSTGHGVPGALMSTLNISCIEKSIESEKLTSPSDILNHTRTKIIETLKKDGSAEGGKDGMDASLICFDFKNSKFTYAAANNPIWIVRNNELIELKGDKMPVGKHDKDQLPFSQFEFGLNKGDVVYTLTDGFPDQFGGKKGKKFMYKQLKETLVSIAQNPMSEQKEALNSILKNWMGDVEQVDDITIIGIRIV